MKSNQKKINKTIYFTDITNEEYFKEIIDENYHVFDRKKIIPHKMGMNRNIFNYFNNINLEQEFINVFKNKKTLNIVYILHYNEPEKILVNIRDKIIQKIKNNENMIISFKYIALKNDHDPHSINNQLYDEVIILDK